MDIIKRVVSEGVGGRFNLKFWVVVAMCMLDCSIALRAKTAPEHLYLEHDTYIDLEQNTSLFDLYPQDENLWSEINKFLYTSIDTKRRGVEWWQLGRLLSAPISANETLEQPTKSLQARLFASTSGYSVGGAVDWQTPLRNEWGISASIFALSGRDAKIEGVFRQEISPSLSVTRNFGQDKYISLAFKVPYKMRGVRSSATQECYTLTHNNLYNPSWGYYGGKVRNSRVVRNLLPSLSARFQTPITSSTLASVWLGAEYGTRKLSRLGWYNASNPTPNYYNKMPSYYEGSASYSSVVESWQQNDTQYTQIAWDKLEQINLMSVDGESHYVVEDMVERVADVDLGVMFDTQLDGGVKVVYGANANLSSRRNYKQMRDLLGGEYLTDMDQYSTDDTHTGNNLQNNLRDPNRKITNGERFGYDYTFHTTHLEAVAAVDYRTSRSSLYISAAIGEESILRDGHYEKERFPGSASYGDSQSITLATYSLSASGGFVLLPQHALSLDLGFNSEAPLSRYIFVNAQYSNRIVESPTTEKIASASLKYRYTSPRVKVAVEGYVLSMYDMQQVWQGYDDISSTYCDVVISDIATRSVGVEVSGEFSIGRRWRLVSTISAGGYIYSSAPQVRLYDDSDLSLVAESQASTLRGYVVGNAPQVATTLGATYFGRKGVVVGVESAYFAKRYIAPSIMRRTDRIVNSMT
ncbi:MAG: hypothetical protein SNI57_02615, partial [Rikenellaceae bacterium]